MGIIATDPDAKIMELRMRYPDYTVTLSKGGKRWIVRRSGRNVGPMSGYQTEARGWQIVASLVTFE